MLDSIPEAHRPRLNTQDADRDVSLIMGGPIKTLGSVMMPILLTTDTNESIKLVFYALVVPELIIPMFISQTSWLQPGSRFMEDLFKKPPVFTISVGNETFKVKGIEDD